MKFELSHTKGGATAKFLDAFPVFLTGGITSDLVITLIMASTSLWITGHPDMGVVRVTWPIIYFLGRNHIFRTAEPSVVNFVHRH